jgi:hypothetical protein
MNGIGLFCPEQQIPVDFATEHGIGLFFEVSSKSGQNVDAAFEAVAREVLDRIRKDQVLDILH